MSVEENLARLNVQIPEASAPRANYVPFKIIGDMLYVSGQLPFEDGVVAVTGRLGDDVSLEEGQRAAKICAINILAQAKAALGSLDRIAEIVKLGAFVSSTADFYNQPAVVNGASDFLVEVLEDAGRHTRFAVGAPSLPLNTAVEIDALIRIK